MTISENKSYCSTYLDMLKTTIMENLPTTELINIVINENINRDCSDLDYLDSASINEIVNKYSLSRLSVSRLKAAFELGKRLFERKANYIETISGPEDIYNLLKARLAHALNEHFICITLDSKNMILSKSIIAKGSVDRCVVHPREIFYEAVKSLAVAVIIVHNHPTGETTPSEDDIKLTGRLCSAGKLIGIPVLDHVIIGRDSFGSFKERGLS